MRKFAKRNRRALFAVGAVVGAIALGLALATHGLVQARRERDRAVAAEAAASAAAVRSQRVLDTIDRMFATFKPAAAGGEWGVLVELLRRQRRVGGR